MGLTSKKGFARAAHCFCTFLCRFFKRLQRKTSRNFGVTRFVEEMSTYVSVVHFFFSLPFIFTLHWWPLAFLILSPPPQNFHVVLPTKKKCLHRFFISRSKSLSSLSFDGLPPTFSFSLSFSCSIFQNCGV